MIGRKLSGRYVVEARVGSGGMAIVYRGRDTIKRQTVAIKVLRPEFEKDEDFVRHFSREAEAASKVSHDNIVNMFDVGMDGDLRYLVMEYVDGKTLKELIREKGRIEPRRAIYMTLRMLAAVDHAHRNGIVHRDIKPQNILVDKNGTVKVADFGIARMKSAQPSQAPGEGQKEALGSVHYFSPEQAQGRVADEKSDLYSVGVVLYEMLTGQVPFDGDTPEEIAAKHIHETPRSMLEIDENISPALEEVVMRALAKDPEQRYQTAAEMALDLRKAYTNPDGGFVHYPLDEEEGKGKKERSLLARLARALLMFMLAGVLAAGIWYIGGVRDTVTMPNLVDMGQEEALIQLEELGLTATSQGEYSEEVEAGRIIQQSVPEGERIETDARIILTVSRGSQWYYLSNFTAQPAEEAKEALEDAGVVVEIAYTLSQDGAEGTVIAQSMEPGYQDKEIPVVLTVAGHPVVMPDLTGLSLEGATALLQAEGLTLGEVYEEGTADTVSGTVIDQSVASGDVALGGSGIDLTVSVCEMDAYQPRAPFTLVVPLDNLQVEIKLKAPSGAEFVGYSENLPRGRTEVTLRSSEPGQHRLTVYMDGVVMETTDLYFE